MISPELVLLLSFVTLMAIGLPIGYSIGISSALTLMLSLDALTAVTTIAQRMATGLDSFSLLAVPFFILAGNIMNRGGIARRLIDLAKAAVGRLPGGLSHVNILANVLFGAVSGSAVAATSAIGGIMHPRMKKEGYPEPYSASVNVSSSITGLIIPPSNVLIVYSLASGGVSIGALFIAGYLPGLLMAVLLMVVAAAIALRKGYPRGDAFQLGEFFRTFLSALPSLFMLLLVIGGIVIGIFTATEASAIAVVYALALAAVYREVKWKDLFGVFLNSAKTTGVVMLLIATSMSMSWVLAYEYIPQSISAGLLALSDNPIVILLIMNMVLLVMGTFMDLTPGVLIFTPIFLPVAMEVGVTPIHFGIMLVLNLSIGLCTPPVGTVLFVGCSVADLKIQQLIRPLLPFYAALIAALLVVTFWPELSTWLPEVVGGGLD